MAKLKKLVTMIYEDPNFAWGTQRSTYVHAGARDCKAH